MRKTRYLINSLFVLGVIAQISLIQLRTFCDLGHIATHGHMENSAPSDHVNHNHKHHHHSHGPANYSETVKVSQHTHSHDENESSSKCCSEVGSLDCQISSSFALDHFDSKLISVPYAFTVPSTINSVTTTLIVDVKTQDPPNLIQHRTTVLII